ncbi:D-alanyl-D-alanine carboxypeptidase family protein [Thalassobacillus sp. CUG 92003]|uniref:D-alanyl-D-alanine carboxypeptidase family protein n=1 Tax=Thalassobacillus sp. CUG 92003 TaxID=2736641 RepID=UPI002101E545|nr:serine hydrolase [Thalassobacillus sp. CUG 92003]
MKKWAIMIMTILIMLPAGARAETSSSIQVSARQAVLMDAESGRVLYEKDAHQTSLIASTTKIMTAIVAIESGKLSEKADASHRSVHTEGSSIYLEEGEKMTLNDLVYGLMLRSGNDAAVAIAEHVGGSVEGFNYLMNEKAAWIGMDESHFDNPHGLDSDTHYSSAHDLALLMRYAMKNETFREVTSSEKYLSQNRDYAWMNKNKLLTQYYPHTTGGKTGYTKQAGRTLVSSAKKGDLELIVVTLNAPSDWNDHQRLYEWGFSEYERVKLHDKGKTDVEGRTFYYPQDVHLPLNQEEKQTVRSVIQLYPEENESMTAGKKIYLIDDEPIIETSFSSEPYQAGFFSQLKSMIKSMAGLGG